MDEQLFTEITLPDLVLGEDILTDCFFDPDYLETIDFLTDEWTGISTEEQAAIENSFLEDELFKDFLVNEDTISGGKESSFQENLQRNSCVSISTQTDEPKSKRRKTGPRQRNSVGKKRLPKAKVILPDHFPTVPEGHGMAMATPSRLNVCPAVPSLMQMQWPLASFDLQGPTVLSHVPVTTSHTDSLPLSPVQFQFIRPLKTLPQHLISLYPAPASHMPNFILCPVNAAIKSIPTSPERSASSSPFTPTAAEMPNMPQPATVRQCVRAGMEQHCKHSVTPNITYDRVPKTPEFVELFQNRIKEHHRHVWKEYGLDRLYTDVRLVQSHIESKTGKNGFRGVEKEILMFDVAGKENAYLERRNLFHVPEGMQRETIALLGNAGMGKSVLVKKICHDWSTGAYSEFKFVFCFECRRLNLHGKHYSLKELLFELSTIPEENCDKVFKYILRNPSQVLLIFDGIDELQEFDRSMLCSVRPSAKQARPVRELFAGLFLKTLLRGCSMLITSRPRDKISQCLAKADKVIEIRGFSPHDIDQYIEKHFEKLSFGTECIRKMKECQYLLSNGYIPQMCRTICVSCEVLFKAGESKIPRTLTHLFLNVIKQGLAAASRYPNNDGTTVKEYFDKLMGLAWTLAGTHKNCLMNSQFASTYVHFALKCGFMQSFLTIPNTPSNERGSVFSSSALQNFFVALHLILASTDSARGKNPLKYISFELKRIKLEDIVRRFLTGLLFIKGDLGLNFHSNRETAKSVHKQQNTVLEYLKTLDTLALRPKKILELCHFAYESQDRGLLEVTASKLKGGLDFQNVDLTPPDVHVLQHIIRISANMFSLDLRNNRIELQDLKDLVGLSNVLSFRVSVIDIVRLWKHLQQTGDVEVLRQLVEKFTIEAPFRVQTMKNILELTGLVQIQAELVACNIHEVPAIKTLKILEFALGPDCGFDGFLRFVKIRPACSSLQHLDLSRNGITDLGVEKLAEALPSLNCLQKLSLYYNQIGDNGAEKIADVLPLLTCLTMLDLQYNRITDIGAQKLAESLKKCPTIKSLKMWNSTIPHGVRERLQQQDSRISAL